MEKEEYISPYKIKKKYDITSNTLRTWAEQNKIKYIRIREGKGKRMYSIKDVEKIFGNTIKSDTRKICCYARVSSDHQKEDLDRQIKFLKENFPNSEIIHDIGSGLNFKRKGFQTLLERSFKGDFTKVVVTYRDRLCRFGLEVVEWIFEKSNTEFVVLNHPTISENFTTQELAEDLLSITTVFVARNNGNRSALFRKQRKEQEKKKKNEEKESESEE